VIVKGNEAVVRMTAEAEVGREAHVIAEEARRNARPVSMLTEVVSVKEVAAVADFSEEADHVVVSTRGSVHISRSLKRISTPMIMLSRR
jgi:hypothetical protein